MGKSGVSREEVLWRGVAAAVEENVELMNGAIMDVEPQIKANFTNSIPREVKCLIHVEGRPHPKLNELQFDVEVDVKINQRLCDDCMKVRGGYFEAIIQIRGGRLTKQEEERILQFIENIEHEFSLSAIARVDNLKSGFDVYFSNKSRAKTVASRLVKAYGMSQKTSFKVVGRREGKSLQRIKILLALPPVIVGDIIKTKKGIIRVIRSAKSSFHGVNLYDGRRISIRYKDEYDYIDLSRRAKQYMVVARGKKSIQLMDLTNYQTIEVDQTDLTQDIQQGSNISAALIDGKLMILPNTNSLDDS
jgi:NMD protein affecting ribosome stability and mRNA decay